MRHTLERYKFPKSLQNLSGSAVTSLRCSSLLLLCIALTLLFCEIVAIPILFQHLTHIRYAAKNLWHFGFFQLCTIVFFLFIPLFINQIFYKEKTSDLGLAIPVKKMQGIIFTAIAFIVTLPLILFAVKLKFFQIFYTLHHPSSEKLAIIIFVFMPLYYFCEEFFFRGFLFLNLWRRVGWHSFWITDIIFVWAHVAKPPLEMLIALPAGIVFAWLTLKTRSIFPSMIVHYSLGVTMQLLVNHVI